uniref:DnaD domain protein n=1 Tax=Candidatus Enterococcus willemsii TaxID=1857215 RepID=UPI00403FA75A
MISLQEYLSKGQTVLSNILIENYRHLGMTNDEFLLWIQLYRYHEAGDEFPDLIPISKNMGITQQDIYQLLNQLVQKNVIMIESKRSSDGRITDYYDFSPIFEKLRVLLKQQQNQAENQQFERQVQHLYQMFEAEFGRPLSPIEYQRIGQWLEEDQYQPELVQLALKEAVLNQAYSLNYIDRILISWERKNIHSTAQVEEEQKRRKRQLLQKAPTSEKKLPKISMHNWLDEE